MGQDPTTGLNVRIKRGPFGAYIQLGEDDATNKPKRVPLPPRTNVDSVSLENALLSLRLPRDIGIFPDTGEMIQANIGRFGPYVRHNKQFVSIPKTLNIYSITLDEAIDLVKKGMEKTAANTRELGQHPKDKKSITIKKSRFGMQITHGKTYIKLPKDTNFESISLQEAIAMLGDKGTKTAKKVQSRPSRKA